MRLPKRTDERLDPEVERELEAIDRALAGEAVDSELAELATLTSELRAERPEPTMRFGAELDRRQQAGFAPERGSRWRRPRSYLAPAGALATLAVIAAVALNVSTQEGPQPMPATTDGGGAALEADEGESADGGASATGLPAPGSEESLEARPGDGAQRIERFRPIVPDSLGEVARAGGLARNQRDRKQDRSAALTLRTDTDRVREVSDQAIEITESAGGVVVSSTLDEGMERSSASLQLSIPSRELDATLDRLTDLATVQSLNEAALDITKPFVSAKDRLDDARAERRELLQALGNAETEAEAEALRKQLRDARRQVSRAEARFERIARRARLAEVGVTVEGVPGGDDDGSWSLGDAADDALSALKTVAGVLLVSAAILAPLAILLALVAYGAVRIRRRRREAALDEG
jgi:Flp pilus assembly protein TadB